ncbi:uncharacterized protein LOC121379359 isoform X2 [Gigantopelta aegis]|uniref:uncharacterized protein LOC121379359 isoform X2 n=1 Tax=Gigantopelta aegis TaxID=1735272 RepID=UPI001B88C45E|nr:uncharacterized protein LOC121379359 isoform X2 [Gigantopelta aegis]
MATHDPGGTSMTYPLVLVFILGPTLHGIVDACGRQPAKPNPTEYPPLITSTLATHRLKCNAAETEKKGCLNDGKCFVVLLGNRTTSCECPEMYIGDRCEEISPDIFVRKGDVMVGGIAGGVSALIIVIAIIIYAVIIIKRRRRGQAARGVVLNGGPAPNGPLLEHGQPVIHGPIDNDTTIASPVWIYRVGSPFDCAHCWAAPVSRSVLAVYRLCCWSQFLSPTKN